MTSQHFLDAFDRWQLPAELPRPRLFVPAGGVERLRALAGDNGAEWRQLKEAADAAVGRGSGRAVAACGLAYLASGERGYAETLLAGAELTLGMENWVHSTHRSQGLAVDLLVAHHARHLAWVYDWLHDALSADQRGRIREAILRRGLELFVPVHQNGSEWWARVTHNWRAVICGEMGLAAMALAGEWPRAKESLRESLEGVLATLDANPEDGSYVEGLGYWSYGMGMTTWFVEALRTFTGGAVDLYQHPYMQRTADFALYLTTPELGSFNFGDDGYRPPSAELLSLLAARTGNASAQWLVERIGGFSPLSLLWRPEAPAPRPPADLPLVKSFPAAGATVMRSDWSDQAVYLGLKTGATTANHSHLDINSLLLTAFGERLLVDSGIWHYDHGGGFFDTGNRRWDYLANATGGHSTLLVDGEGQRYGEAYRGEVVHLESTPQYSYAVAAGADAYGPEVTRFDRHVLLAAEGYVLVIDDVETDGPRRLEWRWQTRGQAELARLAEDRWHILHGCAALDVDLLWPDANSGRTVTRSRVVAHYLPGFDEHPKLDEEALAYVAVVPLHRQHGAVTVVVLHPRQAGAEAAPPARLVSRDHEQVEIAVPRGGEEVCWALRLRERAVTRG
jgi:hypothetical protein